MSETECVQDMIFTDAIDRVNCFEGSEAGQTIGLQEAERETSTPVYARCERSSKAMKRFQILKWIATVPSWECFFEPHCTDRMGANQIKRNNIY